MAYVQHSDGSMVVSASTKEWAIKQCLYSTADVSAAENIGRILAQRCLESGISYLHCNIDAKTKSYERVGSKTSRLKLTKMCPISCSKNGFNS